MEKGKPAPIGAKIIPLKVVRKPPIRVSPLATGEGTFLLAVRG